MLSALVCWKLEGGASSKAENISREAREGYLASVEQLEFRLQQYLCSSAIYARKAVHVCCYSCGRK